MLIYIFFKWIFLFGTVGCFIVLPFFYSFSFDRSDRLELFKSRILLIVSVIGIAYGVSLRPEFYHDRDQIAVYIHDLAVGGQNELN